MKIGMIMRKLRLAATTKAFSGREKLPLDNQRKPMRKEKSGDGKRNWMKAGIDA